MCRDAVQVGERSPQAQPRPPPAGRPGTPENSWTPAIVQPCSQVLPLRRPPSRRVDRLSEFGVSHLSDNVVVLQYVRNQSLVERALTVMKTRASRHEPEIRRFKITPQGILLGDKFDPNQQFA